MFSLKQLHKTKTSIFYEIGGKSGGPSEEKGRLARGVDFAKGVVELATDKEARDLALKTADAINEAESSNNLMLKKTLELLKATGTIQMGLFDRVRTVARFSEGSGKSGARAILKAFEDAKKGIISIVLYSKNSYTPMSMKEYEERVKNNPDELNVGVSQGLWGLFETGNSLGFGKDTWSNISLYAADRGWSTGIIGTNEKMKANIQKLYAERKVQEEKKIDAIIQTEFKGIEKNNPILLETLKKHSLKYTEGGNIDVGDFINKMDVKSLNEIPKQFENLAKDLSKDAKELEKKAKETFGTLTGTNAKELGISGLDNRLSRLPFIAYNQDDALKVIEESQKLRQTLKDGDPKAGELTRLISGLITLHKAVKIKQDAVDLSTRSKQAKNAIQKSEKEGKTLNKETLAKEITTKDNNTEVTFAKKLSEKRDNSDRTKDLLAKYNINNYESASKKLAELEKKGNLNDEEANLLILIKEYIRNKNTEAQVYQASVKEFGQERARELFTSTNRFTSDKPDENYDFKAIEKIAAIRDPESSAEVKSLYNLTTNDTPMKLDNTSGYSESYFLGNSSLYATSAGDGYVYITNKGGSPLLDIKLRPYQVESVKKEVLALQSIGMENLVPMLPELTSMIGGDYRVNGFDGEFTDGELNRLLSAMEKLTLGPGEYPTVGNNVEKMKAIRGKATQHGRLPREYYENFLRTEGYINDDGTLRKEMLRQKLQS